MFMQPCVFLSDRSHIKKFTPNNYLYIKNVRRLNIRHLTFLFISIKHAADAGPHAYHTKSFKLNLESSN